MGSRWLDDGWHEEGGRGDTRRIGYPGRVALLACPFCREMYEDGEEDQCPICAVALVPFDKLPPSPEALHDEGGVPLAPEEEPLRFSDMRRGKGALALLGIAGIALFFLPWVHLTMPYTDTRTGFDLAHGRIGWLWGACVSWLVLLPTVLSRRTILQLRGARVAAAFLAAIPSVSIGLLLSFPPKGVRGVPVAFTWGWPFWATLGVSIAAVLVASRLGGRVDDIRVTRGSSAGQALH